MPEFLLRFLWVRRSVDTVSSSLESSVMRCSIFRLSSSSFFSPAPLLLMLPLAPPCLLKASCSPTSRGRRYLSLATSTCSLASLVLARLAKISSIRLVLSITGSLHSSFKLRSWDGVRLSSKTISSASVIFASSRSSSTLPVPI